MRPDVIEGATEVVEVALLGTEVGLRRSRGLALEGSVHSFVTAVLLRLTGLDGLRTVPSRIHQALSRVRRARPMEAKGVPLSERMTAGRPNSRKALMNTGLASSIDVE